ncbi:hypothetical protein CANCADRAFT_32741 [Tortispora caseinolytica NRRL Y-17796]|uniref:Mitochondrial import inner membrane translocase subunit n=1 Tax=Tortispora caseinolytica NRRL Y-17796 TaxID=767744 RepID=A0A1E4TCM2_9ASCO|nr:hypothetical protein CANCADRAFT_32741 [Tortispora caseinolytica NRRL Y-17796]
MSLFGMGGGSGAVDQNKIMAAEAELDMVTDMFNRLVDVCHQKCITPKYAEGELSKGESVCIDRCVAKYFQVNVQMGEHLQKMGPPGGGKLPGM